MVGRARSDSAEHIPPRHVTQAALSDPIQPLSLTSKLPWGPSTEENENEKKKWPKTTWIIWNSHNTCTCCMQKKTSRKVYHQCISISSVRFKWMKLKQIAGDHHLRFQITGYLTPSPGSKVTLMKAPQSFVISVCLSAFFCLLTKNICTHNMTYKSTYNIYNSSDFYINHSVFILHEYLHASRLCALVPLCLPFPHFPSCHE